MPTNPELKACWDNVEKFAHEGDVEETISAIAKWVEKDLEIYKQKAVHPHPAVVSCLEGCVEMLRHAAFNFYASTK